jgi:hypothetical protein
MVMRLNILGLILISPVFIAASQESRPDAATCDKIIKHEAFSNQKWFCTPANAGFILAQTDASSNLSKAITEAEQRFTLHFNQPSAKIAIILGGEISQTQSSALREMKLASLPWLDQNNMRSTLENAVKEQVKAQTAGLPPEKQEEIIQQALAKLPKQNTTSDAAYNKQIGALSHEIGHIWFRLLFDGEPSDNKNTPNSKRAPRYGSTAPDWLDEVSAILAENQTLTTSRWESLLKSTKTIPFEQFFAMPHPLFDKALSSKHDGQSEALKGGARVRVFTGADAEKMIGQSEKKEEATVFYAQARAFADFAIERSGDPKIFAKIASAFQSETSLDKWLKDHGSKAALGDSVAKMEQTWEKWLTLKKASQTNTQQ